MPDQAGRARELPELPALEAELRALGREIDAPAVPDLTAGVLRRIGQPGPAGGTRRARWRMAVVVVLALLAVLAVTPPGRAVITHVIRFAGVELRAEPGPTPTSTPTSSSTTGPLPGERVMTFDQARRLVTFQILVPAAFGAPETVTVRDGGRVVSLVYPRTPYGEVRLDEFDGHLDSVMFTKFVQADDATEVRVAGRKAMWVAGPHEVFYVRPDGISDTASARLTTGNTLIWDTGRVALRLEGAIGRDRAIAIAATATRP